jgi:hypothetical protein
VLAGVVRLSPRAASAQPDVRPQPWQVGKCYRVFPADRDQLYIFKVLEPPAGAWVRVQSDPSNPEVPGARPQAAVWLNTASAFSIQEWPCQS